MEINPDVKDLVFIYKGINSGEEYSELTLTKEEYEEGIKTNGIYTRHLSGIFLSSIFQLWEDHYRERIATELGVSKNELKSDLFGEIRLLRQALTHNHFKPTSDLKKLNILSFINITENIDLYTKEFHEIVSLIYKELEKFE